METVRIVNPVQCAYYVKNSVKPIDLYTDENTGRLVFIFDKDKAQPYWEQWRDRKADFVVKDR